MNLLYIFQIIVSILLITLILLQAKGTGLGSAFGGGGASFHSKRGMEMVIFRATLVIATLFIAISIIALL